MSIEYSDDPTRAFTKETKKITVAVIGEAGSVNQELGVDVAFAAQLALYGIKINRTPDVSILPIQSRQATGLATDLRDSSLLPDGQRNIKIRNKTISFRALGEVLVGRPETFTKFKSLVRDPITGIETPQYYFPVIESSSGNVILLSTTLEAAGQLKDAARKYKASQADLEQTRSSSSESRIDIVAGANREVKTYQDSGYNGGKEPRAVEIEVASGDLTIAKNNYQFELGSSLGDRDGKDEDMCSVNKYRLPNGKEFIHLGVFDGMGGMGSGDVASKLASEAAKNYLNSLDINTQEWTDIQTEAKTKNESVEVTVARRCIAVENQAIYDFNNADPNARRQSGATVAQAFVFEDGAGRSQVVSINSGDARLYKKSNGNYYRKSKDHSLVESLVAIGQLKPEEVPHHPQRNVVYGSLGDKAGVNHIDLFITPIQVGEEIVLTCDGIWEAIKDTIGGDTSKGRNENDFVSPEMAALMKDGKLSVGHAANVIVDAINKRPGDNVSFVRLVQK